MRVSLTAMSTSLAGRKTDRSHKSILAESRRLSKTERSIFYVVASLARCVTIDQGLPCGKRHERRGRGPRDRRRLPRRLIDASRRDQHGPAGHRGELAFVPQTVPGESLRHPVRVVGVAAVAYGVPAGDGVAQEVGAAGLVPTTIQAPGFRS